MKWHKGKKEISVQQVFDLIINLSKKSCISTRTLIEAVLVLLTEKFYFDDNNDKLNISLNFTLGEEYFNRNWPLIDQRLTQAGRRLALLLNQLDKNRSSRKLPPDTQALIIVLCIGLSIVIFAALSVYIYKRKNNTKPDILMCD
ncbi:unnamed protein product [Rotaria sp. Silwood1]|nr:unnamed protein product [Rotaria sp. Silwood1]CAF1310684.1 unnamed protein product [Rotaria sp. Silwood1]